MNIKSDKESLINSTKTQSFNGSKKQNKKYSDLFQEKEQSKVIKIHSKEKNKENPPKKRKKSSNSKKKKNNKEHDNENNNDIDEDEDEDEKNIKKYFDVSSINNIQIPKEYINSIYHNLLTEEEKGITPKATYNYMKKQKEINEKMRSILIDWLIDVHFKFCFTDETLFMTVSIIDRYLSVNQVTRNNFQLLGITALMIATKHEEIDLPKVADFIYITDNAYVKEEVIKMEQDVLSTLNYFFLYPSPIKFFEYLSLHFNFEKKHHMMGKYLMESFLVDIKNIKYKPSIISCACTYIVMKFFKMKNYHESYNKQFYLLDNSSVKYTEHNIKECAKDICIFVDNINKTNYQACFKKYSKPEQESVAILIVNNKD